MRRILNVVAALTIVAVLTLAGFSCAASARESQSRKSAAPPTGRFVRAGDVEIYLQEAGNGNRTPVVFIHGTGAWSETWRGSMTALANAGFRSVAIDLPPFGFSERPKNNGYSLVDQGKRIVGVLDALGFKQAILVGHSFGGGPTVEAALMGAHRIKGLVLVDAALGLDAPSSNGPSIQKALIGFTPLRDALSAATITNPMLTKRFLRSFIFNKEAATDARVAIYQQPFIVEGSTKAVSSWVPTFLSRNQVAMSLDPKAYVNLRMPVSLIWGVEDTITPVSQAERVKQLIPHAELSLLAGVGHIPQIEDPARFDAALLEFLTKK
jgi:pimeloyl-ACP methyl ester carboxylesterase